MQKPPFPSTILSKWPGRIALILLLSLFIRCPHSGGRGKLMACFNPPGFYLPAENQFACAPATGGDCSFHIRPAAQGRSAALVSSISRSPPAPRRMKIPNIRCPDGFAGPKTPRQARDDCGGENCRAIPQGGRPPQARTRANGRN